MSSEIYTSSPVKKRLELELLSRKGNKKCADDSESESEAEFSVHDDSDDYVSESEKEEPVGMELGPVASVSLNDYVLVAFNKDRPTNIKYFVGCVTKEEDEDGDVEVSVLRQSCEKISFT